MLKFFILIFLQTFLISTPSKALECRSVLSLGPYISLDSISLSQKKILSAKPTELDHLVQQELQSYAEEGNRRFLLSNGQFIFESSMSHLENASGVTRDAIYRAHYNGQSYIIKQLSRFLTSEQIALKEVQNARLMNLLSLGPQTHLVTRDNKKYLVMHEVPGINIKEVLNPHTATSTTSLKVRKMLGLSFRDAEIRGRFAQAFLASPELMRKLDLVQKKLETYDFTRVRDFQFMIDFRGTKPTINIIDVASFRRFEPNPDPNFSPRAVILDLIQDLKRLSTF